MCTELWCVLIVLPKHLLRLIWVNLNLIFFKQNFLKIKNSNKYLREEAT